MPYEGPGRETRSERAFRWFPKLERAERIALVGKFSSDSVFDIDFIVMMGLSTALASLGLLLNSTAVVIGAMLVAPLMTPLVAAGFALVQGNLSLFRQSIRAMLYGIAMGLAVAMAVGAVTPSYDPTLEVQARTEVNILDLAVALFSGMAGAYAIARPKVAATVAGVAIAAALVPPLSVVGIGIAHGRPSVAGLAAVLFVANIVSIVFGSAIIFRLAGVRRAAISGASPIWARVTIFGLLAATLALMYPLRERFVSQISQGQARPLTYPLSPKVRKVIRATVDEWPGVDILSMGRISVEPEQGLTVVLISDDLITPELGYELREAVYTVLPPSTPVRVIPVLEAWEGAMEELPPEVRSYHPSQGVPGLIPGTPREDNE